MATGKPQATFERKPYSASTSELRLEGRVYADVAPQLRDELTRAVDGGVKNLIVDATKLEQIDSAGLNEFVQLLKKVRPQGGRVVFFGLSPSIQRVFDITKLNKVMSVVGTRDDAVGVTA